MGWFRRGAKKSDSMADEALRRLDGRLLKYAVRRETDENGQPD